MVRVLHFADAHIDMANYGRFDPEALLPVRVTDFLKSLDRIVQTAVDKKVDLVIFSGDAYKDRNPHPTFQREWGRQLMVLSQAKIPTILLVGNHDVSPAAGRAHTIAEFDTLQVPHIFVGDRMRLYKPDQLGAAVQVITLPWIPRSRLVARGETAGKSMDDLYLIIEELVTGAFEKLMREADPELPTILTAHASVTGAKHGSERMVMLGNELVLTQALVRDPRLDYVALGHIHKHQELNPGGHPPVVYAGSIERIDFGEARETKGFVLAEVSRGETTWEFVPLDTRPFIDLALTPKSAETMMDEVLSKLPPPNKLEGAIVRLQLTYPTDWEAMLDDATLLKAMEPALEARIVKKRSQESRARLGDTAAVETLAPVDLLDLYWKATEMDPAEAEPLQALGAEIIRDVDQDGLGAS